MFRLGLVLLCMLSLLLPLRAWAQYPIANGGSYTPQGAITYLILLHDDVPGQGQEANNTPANLQRLFYPSDSGFSPAAGDYTISNRLYQNSLGAPQPLRLSAYVHPELLTGPRDSIPAHLRRYYAAHPPPAGFWQGFDRRRNKPDWTSFQLRNLPGEPDGLFDGVIILSADPRTHRGNSGQTPLDYFNRAALGPLRIDAQAGFKLMAMDSDHLQSVLLHELAHSLYKSPHHSGANDVVGPYWLGTGMYGLMNFARYNSVVPAWERHILGWDSLTPPTVLAPETHPKATRVVLHDFVRTGRAARLVLPGTGQRIWLEFYGDSAAVPPGHPLLHRDLFTADGLGRPIPPMSRGLIAYVEDMGDGLAAPGRFGRGTMQLNGLRWLTGTPIRELRLDSVRLADPAYWGNPVGRFSTGAEEPASAQTMVAGWRGDMAHFGSPGLITTTGADGGGPLGPIFKESCFVQDRVIEVAPVLYRDGRWTYEGCGTGTAFRGVGKKWGLASNPMLQVGHQQYLTCSERVEPVRLSGLSMRILSQGPDSVALEIRYDDVTIDRSTRYTGEVVVTDVPGQAVDLRIAKGARLLVNRSGASTRRTRTPYDSSFVNPSLLRLATGTRTQVDGSLIVQDNSALWLEAGAVLRLARGSHLRLGAGATLHLDSAARLLVDDGAELTLAAGAWLHRASGARLVQAPQARVSLKAARKGHSAAIQHYALLPKAMPPARKRL